MDLVEVVEILIKWHIIRCVYCPVEGQGETGRGSLGWVGERGKEIGRFREGKKGEALGKGEGRRDENEMV